MVAAPASSSTILVSTVAFNIRGEVFQTTDPMGAITQQSFDNAGRRLQQIENVASVGVGGDVEEVVAGDLGG